MSKYIQLTPNEFVEDISSKFVVTFSENDFNAASTSRAPAFLVKAFETSRAKSADDEPVSLSELSSKSQANVKGLPDDLEGKVYALCFPIRLKNMMKYVMTTVFKALEARGAEVHERETPGGKDLGKALNSYGYGVYISQGLPETEQTREQIPTGELEISTSGVKTEINSLSSYRQLQQSYGRKSLINQVKNEAGTDKRGGATFEPLLVEAYKRDSWIDKSVEAVRTQSLNSRDLFVYNGSLVRIFDNTIIPVEDAQELIGYISSHREEAWGDREGAQHTFSIQLAAWKKGPDASEFSVDGYHLEIEDIKPEHVSHLIKGKQYHDGFLPLKSVSGVPYMKADGTLALEPGYHDELEVYVDRKPMQRQWDHSKATQADAQAALKWIKDEVYVDFPFEGEADLANIIGAPLMTITQHQHGDRLPLVGISARGAGTGKTYLSEILSYIVSDREDMNNTKMPSDETELIKTIGGILQQSDPVIVWDNLSRGAVVNSPALANLHTAKSVNFRLLGQSQMVKAVNDRLWIANGNGIRPGEDLVRRWLHIGLDAANRTPNAMKKNYRHDNITKWVYDHRVEILEQYAIMIAAWHNAGRPEAKNAEQIGGGFQKNVDMVSGILEFAGESNFWHNYDQIAEDSFIGTEDEELYEFLMWIHQQEELDGLFTSQDITDLLLKTSERMGGSKEFLAAVPLPESVSRAWSKGRGGISLALGRYLSGVNRQRVGSDEVELYLDKCDVKRSGNKTQWELKASSELSRGTGAWNEMLAISKI